MTWTAIRALAGGQTLIAAALAGKALPKELSVTGHADGRWILENSSTGETISGFVAP